MHPHRRVRRALAAKLAVLLCVAGFGSLVATIAQADPRTPLGGLELRTYCQTRGYTCVVLQNTYVLGEQAAYNNWRCYTDMPTNTHPLSMEQACKWAYGI